MATTIERTAAGVDRRKRPVGWALGGLVAVALAAVTVATVIALRPTPHVPVAGPVEVRSAGAPLYTAQEQAIMRLVAQGYLPAGTLQGRTFVFKSLVNRGLIPRESLTPYQGPVESLYTDQELAVMAAVAQGLVPREVLDGEPFLTKRLINQGLIPREAAGS
jgi:hypothetical protein